MKRKNKKLTKAILDKLYNYIIKSYSVEDEEEKKGR